MTRNEFLSAYVRHLRSIVTQLSATKEACDGALQDSGCPVGARETIGEHSAQCERYLKLFEREFLPRFERLEARAALAHRLN